jgi:prevent-host-death family protein
MLSMQSNEVKAQLSEVLRKVEDGQVITITRHGKPIACLSPWKSKHRSHSSRIEAVENIKRFRKHTLEKGESTTEMRNQGRR